MVLANGHGHNPAFASALKGVQDSKREDVIDIVAHVSVEKHWDGLSFSIGTWFGCYTGKYRREYKRLKSSHDQESWPSFIEVRYVLGGTAHAPARRVI
jgi:fructose/tagatose bisphosphate aldolase